MWFELSDKSDSGLTAAPPPCACKGLAMPDYVMSVDICAKDGLCYINLCSHILHKAMRGVHANDQMVNPLHISELTVWKLLITRVLQIW